MNKIFFLICIILMVSCSSDRPVGKTEAEVLFKEANDLVKDGQYTIANQKLNLIKSQYSYSIYAARAELMSADIYFKQENFVQAASDYLIFKDMHPTNSQLDYVYRKIADSFFMQRPSTYDRDLTPCQQAIKFYDQFLLKFPSSVDVKLAKKNKKICFKMIREKDQYIADFYYKTNVYDAAIFRYKNILQKFSNQSLREHSMVRIIKSFSHLKKSKECRDYYSRFINKIGSKYKNDVKNICQ